jgi:hypothetical protein
MSDLPDSIEYMSETNVLSVADDRQDPDADAVRVPLARLEERICELAAHLAAGTCRFLGAGGGV